MQYLVFVLIFVFSCSKPQTKSSDIQELSSKKAVPAGAVTDTAVFAGGCFWCMEGPFEKIDGVYDAISGYTGGHTVNPKYEEVGSGTTGHRESIEVIYDPQKVTYDQLLDIFWMSFNPTDAGGQFADRGEQYTSAIFYRNDAQKKAAEASKERLAKSGKFDKPIVTPIIKASAYYPAEDYHQDFYKKDPEHYNRYREGSGRASYLRALWGDHH